MGTTAAIFEEQTLKDMKRAWRTYGISIARKGEEPARLQKDVGSGSAYFRTGNPNPLFNASVGMRSCLGQVNNPLEFDWEYHTRKPKQDLMKH
jgi:hypothetical protein